MLVLSRKIEEKLLVNGNIEIRVLGISKGRVRLGIEAPREISIERKELLETAAVHEDEALLVCAPSL